MTDEAREAMLTTEEVRRRCTTGAPGSALDRSSSARANAEAGFDRWLAVVRREARADGIRQAREAVAGGERYMHAEDEREAALERIDALDATP
jgi:hypothetical protein